jgi:hypothetical protein
MTLPGYAIKALAVPGNVWPRIERSSGRLKRDWGMLSLRCDNSTGLHVDLAIFADLASALITDGPSALAVWRTNLTDC